MISNWNWFWNYTEENDKISRLFHHYPLRIRHICTSAEVMITKLAWWDEINKMYDIKGINS